MRCFKALCLCAALVCGASPAFAVRLPDFTPSAPVERQQEARYTEQPQTPYAMNYTDEVAQSLGVKRGRVDFFSTGPSRNDDPFIPSLKGGVDRGGAMLRLQWHPGE